MSAVVCESLNWRSCKSVCLFVSAFAGLRNQHLAQGMQSERERERECVVAFSTVCSATLTLPISDIADFV